MKRTFQQNLSLGLSLALCALCAWQWQVMSVQRAEVGRLGGDVGARDAALLVASNAIQTADHQIARLDGQLTVLQDAASTNGLALAERLREIARLQAEARVHAGRMAACQTAVDGLEGRLREALAGLEKQNATIQRLVVERDELVAKHNAAMQDRNDVVAKYNDVVRAQAELVAKYNDLVRRVEQKQSGQP